MLNVLLIVVSLICFILPFYICSLCRQILRNQKQLQKDIELLHRKIKTLADDLIADESEITE
jgi:hypothetical protein